MVTTMIVNASYGVLTVSDWHPIDPALFCLPIDAAHASDLASWEDQIKLVVLKFGTIQPDCEEVNTS